MDLFYSRPDLESSKQTVIGPGAPEGAGVLSACRTGGFRKSVISEF